MLIFEVKNSQSERSKEGRRGNREGRGKKGKLIHAMIMVVNIEANIYSTKRQRSKIKKTKIKNTHKHNMPARP
jgi:hypothetical protein